MIQSAEAMLPTLELRSLVNVPRRRPKDTRSVYIFGLQVKQFEIVDGLFLGLPDSHHLLRAELGVEGHLLLELPLITPLAMLAYQDLIPLEA